VSDIVKRRVLVSTLWADGGVAMLARKTIALLQSRGFDVALAYYMPYKEAPELSVPSWQLLTRRPGRRLATRFGVPAHEIGVRLPEFEWARGLLSRQWAEVINDYDFHLAICGSVLAAMPPLLAGKPCLAWVSTPYFEDRKDRRNSFPFLRRLLDSTLDTPICRLLEKWALGRAEVLAVSRYTQSALQRLAPSASIARMPIPVNPLIFFPLPRKDSVRRIGFAGRYDDPRKNIKLLIDAVALCREGGLDLVLDLAGGKRTPELESYARERGVGEQVTFCGFVSNLPDFYRSLDVFVIPSLQEGLAIVGLEAMACGCPVVSTRCGGPEEYVIDGVNGQLVSFDAAQMAGAIASVIQEPERRSALAQCAMATVRENYSEDAVAAIFWHCFEKTFGTERAIDE
jgi:glycosyltransferase involved in cell wall biosynthesis